MNIEECLSETSYDGLPEPLIKTTSEEDLQLNFMVKVGDEDWGLNQNDKFYEF